MQFLKTQDQSNFCFFSDLTQEQVQSLNLKEIGKTYVKGDTIFRSGEYPKCLYVVYQGAIKIHKYGESGKEQINRMAKPGDLLGYRTLFSGTSYSATATATEQVKLFAILKEDFFNLLSSNFHFSKKIFALLASDLEKAENKVLAMAQFSVRVKIAQTLIELSQKFGLSSTGELETSLSRKEIGDLAGVTTESAIRTLSDFNKEQLVTIDKKKIILKNFSGLLKEGKFAISA